MWWVFCALGFGFVFWCTLFDCGFAGGYLDEVVVVFVFILLALTFSRLESGLLSLG